MLFDKNNAIIAAAGSGKTTFIFEHALANIDKKILILTYTIDNLEQIKKCFVKEFGYIPVNITIQSWFSFLITECIRPYQNFLYTESRINKMHFSTHEDMKNQRDNFVQKVKTRKYYFRDKGEIYSHRMSEFACQVNEVSNQKVINRLEQLFEYIFIDEVQDLAGYDLDIIQLFCKSSIKMFFVGDHRQVVYLTNHSRKNNKYKLHKIIDFFTELHLKKVCKLSYKIECFRCNSLICEFADKLYPSMPKTESKNFEITNHDGIFIIKKELVSKYIKKMGDSLRILRYNKTTNTLGFPSINFGVSKGLTFDRVLIFPTKSIEKYLKTGKISEVGDIPKFYVAVTRAKYSVAIVYDGKCSLKEINQIESDFTD